MSRVNDWEYGKIMLKDKVIKSLDDWSDDKEMAYSIMDRKFDYLWWEENGEIWFEDRLYQSFQGDEWDEIIEERMANGTLKIGFENYDDVFRWIVDHSKESDDEWWDWMKERIGA